MQTLLQHEARRSEGKLGAQHPRTQQLYARLESNLQLVRTFEVEGQLMRIEVPEVGEDGALVHGRIADEHELGIERLTVCLVDRSGAPVPETREPMTDASGYFAIVMASEIVDRLTKQYPDGIFLAVFTLRRRLVHRQPKPLALERGALLIVNVRLNRKDFGALPSERPDPVVTPDLLGLTESEAMAVLDGAGLRLGDRNTKAAPDQIGCVLDQSPAAGIKMARGSFVSLVIGIGETETVQMPNLINVTLKTAKRKIKAARLKLGTVSGPSPTDNSVVDKQEPLAEADVPINTPVNLVVRRDMGED
jgi:hypothetical protein